MQGGSDARYPPTGPTAYALGDALLAVAFDVGRLEVTGGPCGALVPVEKEVARPGNPALNTATANYAVSEGYAGLPQRHLFRTGGASTDAQPGVCVRGWTDRAAKAVGFTFRQHRLHLSAPLALRDASGARHTRPTGTGHLGYPTSVCRP